MLRERQGPPRTDTALNTWVGKADCSTFNKPRKLVVLHQYKSLNIKVQAFKHPLDGTDLS